MKICAACLEELPREGFSNKQWNLRQYQRRCKGCIAADRAVQLDPPPKEEPNRDVLDEPSPPLAADGEEATCWICIGSDEPGLPLRRDCSCRGEDAGFSHLPCLVEYAKHKTESWDGRDNEKFSEAWIQCPRCEQRYQNTLSVPLAAEFVTFVEKKYPGDRSKRLEALFHKMLALADTHPGEAKEAGYKILSAIDQTNHPLPRRVMWWLMNTHAQLGSIYLDDGTNESDKLALNHFEKSRDLCIELDYSAEDATMIDDMVAVAKRKCEGDISENSEERLRKSRALYAQRVASDPEGHPSIICAGVMLAGVLYYTTRVVEAEVFLAKLVATCERVHGLNHRLTKNVERARTICRRRCAVILASKLLLVALFSALALWVSKRV